MERTSQRVTGTDGGVDPERTTVICGVDTQASQQIGKAIMPLVMTVAALAAVSVRDGRAVPVPVHHEPLLSNPGGQHSCILFVRGSYSRHTPTSENNL